MIAARDRITILASYNRMSVFYSLFPIVNSHWNDTCDLTQSLRHCLRTDRNRILIIVRSVPNIDGRASKLEVLARLRDKYDKIVWFDDGDGAGSTSFDVLPFVDLYWKKQLFRDRDLYRRSLYGKQLYTDYYHRRHGVFDDPPRYRLPISSQADLGKLRVAWNIGAGAFPIQALAQRAGVALARTLGRRGINAGLQLRRITAWLGASRTTSKKRQIVFARYSQIPARATINYQRQLTAELLHHGGEFSCCIGRVPKRQYDQEMATAAITLSPFGWGEVCFRDFEAILLRSALAKADMGHVVTWPNVYRSGETYISLSWDGSDLIDKLNDVLHDQDRQTYLTANALDVLEGARRNVSSRVDRLFYEIVQ
jgi:hypothetical protein